MIYEKKEIPVGDLGSVVLTAYCADLNEEIDPLRRRPAAVICPGGGYAYRSFREAEPIALQMIARGINAFIVDYHVAPDRYPRPQQDAAAAMAYVRAHAEEYRIDPRRVALMGFSAGGHLAASLGVLGEKDEIFSPLNLTWEKVRPDLLVLCYPVITGGVYAHRGSFENLTGETDLAKHDALSLEKYVSACTPETFIWHTWADGAVPVQNSLLFASALAENHVRTELHIYPDGGHGLSLGTKETARGPEQIQEEVTEWVDLAARFIKGKE